MILPTVFRRALRQPCTRSPLFFWTHSLTPASMVPMHARLATHKSTKATRALKSSKKAESHQLPPPQSTKTPKPKTKAPPKPEIKPRGTPSSPPKYVTLEEILGSQEGPTLLYRKSNSKLKLVCYAATGLGIWCMYNYYQDHIANPVGAGNSLWVKATYYTVIALFGVSVVAILTYPWRLINTIHAIPYRHATDLPPTVRLKIYSNNVLPFLPALKTEVALNDVYLAHTLAEPPSLEVIPVGKFDRFVHSLSFGPWKLFIGFKQAITRENMVPLRVRSSSMLLYIHRDGWQWERRGLNRLMGTSKHATQHPIRMP